MQCAGCTLRFLWPQPGSDEQTTLYSEQYFHSAERRTSMASAAATLHRLGQEAQREGQPEAVRAHGALLAQAVEDLLDVVAASLLRRRGLGASETLTAYHRAHHPRESFPAGRP